MWTCMCMCVCVLRLRIVNGYTIILYVYDDVHVASQHGALCDIYVLSHTHTMSKCRPWFISEGKKQNRTSCWIGWQPSTLQTRTTCCAATATTLLVYIYIYVYIYVHTHIRIHMYVYTCIRIYICILESKRTIAYLKYSIYVCTHRGPVHGDLRRADSWLDQPSCKDWRRRPRGP